MTEELYKSLENACKQLNHKQVLQTANKIIKTDKTPPESVQISKSLSLIFLNHPKEALEALKDYSSLTVNLIKAYILHKLGKHEEAFSLVENVTSSNLSEKELKSQIFYRLGRYKEAGDILRQIELVEDDLIIERQTNLIATEYMGKCEIDFLTNEYSSYEPLFNLSLVYYRNKDYLSALKYIQKSLDLFECQKSTDPDLKSDQTKLRVQYALLLQLTDNVKEAIVVYEEIFSHGFNTCNEVDLCAALNSSLLNSNGWSTILTNIWNMTIKHICSGKYEIKDIHKQIIKQILSQPNSFEITNSLLEIINRFRENDESIEMSVMYLTALFNKGEVAETVALTCTLLSSHPKSQPLISLALILEAHLRQRPVKNSKLLGILSSHFGGFDEIVQKMSFGGERMDISLRVEKRAKKQLVRTTNVAERWLPKRERTVKGRNGVRLNTKGPQGDVNDIDKMNIVNMAEKVPAPPIKQAKNVKGKHKRRRK